MTNDFDIWDGEVPFIANGDGNFDIWEENSPYLDEAEVPEVPVRRRSFVLVQSS